MRAAFVITAVVVTLASLTACRGSDSTPPTSEPAPALDVTGTWKNERGSELKVLSVTGGRLVGEFRSSVGKVDAATWFPAVGFVRGDVVGFTVDFGSAGSVAAWAGQVDGTKLMTQWHLSRDVADADEGAKLWSSILSGADTFVRE